MRIIKTLLFICACFALCSFFSPRSNGPWVFIGDKIAAYTTDRDVLHVEGNDAFRQIKLKITGANLHILDVVIFFENDEEMDVQLRSRYRQGQESRVIDLPGGLRRIKKIEFLYSTVGFVKGRARVAVWGRK